MATHNQHQLDDALLKGCRRNTVSCTAALLRMGANPNCWRKPLERGPCTPLAVAAAHGRLPTMRALLNSGAVINACNNCALFSAFQYGQLGAAELLLEQGACARNIMPQLSSDTVALEEVALMVYRYRAVVGVPAQLAYKLSNLTDVVKPLPCGCCFARVESLMLSGG